MQVTCVCPSKEILLPGGQGGLFQGMRPSPSGFVQQGSVYASPAPSPHQGTPGSRPQHTTQAFVTAPSHQHMSAHSSIQLQTPMEGWFCAWLSSTCLGALCRENRYQTTTVRAQDKPRAFLTAQVHSTSMVYTRQRCSTVAT